MIIYYVGGGNVGHTYVQTYVPQLQWLIYRVEASYATQFIEMTLQNINSLYMEKIKGSKVAKLQAHGTNSKPDSAEQRIQEALLPQKTSHIFRS